MDILCEKRKGAWEKEYDCADYTKRAGAPLDKIYEEVYWEATGKNLEPVHIHTGTDVRMVLKKMEEMYAVQSG